ncbi:MAG: M23 family metallopeptidase [Bacteroidia bacterium]
MYRYLLLFLIAILMAGAQHNEYGFPQNDFISPLEKGTPLILAGTFGELRSNHFHGGLDLKTKGQVGMKLRAVADGYISRIKVSSYGYGTVLYIDHPNGYTSVYAHLQGFNDKIEKFVKTIQTEKESWAIEVYLGKNEIKVEQGEFVAVSGNTGASRAPHLHFEIRNSKTQIPVDPLLCGYEIEDKTRPRIYRVQIHPYGQKSMARVVYTNGRNYTRVSKPIVARVSGNNGQNKLYPIKEVQGQGKIGFSISSYDFHDGSYNKLGVPIIEMKVDGKMYFKQDIVEVPFSKTRYLNALIDYEAKKRQGRYYYRSHIIAGNKLSIYPVNNNDGFLILNDTTLHHIEFSLKDRMGNMSTLSFNVRGVTNYNFNQATLSAESQQHVPYNEKSKFETDELRLGFPANGFYENFELQYKDEGMSSYGISHTHNIHNGYTPIHKFYSVSIKAHNLKPRYYDKTVVCRWGRSEGGHYKDGFITARSKYFGKFYLRTDTIAPAISLYNIYNGKNMRRNSTLLVKIGDNLTGIDNYKTYINGKFIVMSYDYKSGFLRYRFEEPPNGNEHFFEIIVKDKVGNQSRKEVKFIR